MSSACASPRSSDAPSPRGAASESLVIGLIGRFVLSMGVVLGVMVLAAKVARNRNFGGMRTKGKTTKIEVLARQQFGKGSSVAVVLAGGKTLVLGVTEQMVTVLAEADPSAIEIEAGPEA